ncbi:uncharacterized protein F5147DRAFT_685863 [Suillus discolor]|uniref:DUF4211 domain-containing protein n=1 Tax=Suillus discolor TaxID=1912936 RepID=A0A9P7JW14_9AGAM|nr:uncharacterized protein F5147DRAFT_685863 [Suillus discolor]KAG2111588.1 hypothetical protein F5147DRAFT_685863 [Suillus discolor]
MKASKSSSPKRMKQKTLGDFLFPSSPPPISPPAPVKKRQVKQKHKVIALDSDTCDDLEQDSDVGAIKFEPQVIDVSDEDDSPRRPSARRFKKSLVVTDSLPDVAASDNSLEDHIGIPIAWKGSKNGKRKKRKAIADSDDESQPRKRKLIKGARPPSPEGSVIDEVDENDIIESRLRARDKKTTFQRRLEKLKSFRGKKRSEITLELDSESSESDAEPQEGPVVRPFKGARPDRGHESKSSSGEHEKTDEDDDFIVEDDEHGVLTTQLPIAFSMNTHQDLAHQFKIVCQLFVHMAVRFPPDRRPFMKKMLETEEYFSVPLQVARRKLSGMKDSLVTSSVWKPQFKRPLERYPKFELVRMKFSAPQCDACNLGGRISTLIGRVSGKPYDKYDFEPEPEDESSSSSDNKSLSPSGTDSDDMISHKSSGKQFYLGRFCAARTRVFHEFSHWEYHLYHSLLEQIDEVLDGNRGFVRIAFAGGLEPPKDMRDADKVMDWLDQRGLIEFEWQRVRELMDRARNLEIRAKRGGDQDDQDM